MEIDGNPFEVCGHSAANPAWSRFIPENSADLVDLAVEEIYAVLCPRKSSDLEPGV